jgi:cellulose synthase/poly-beta-1,6-N-acetylglucosamine synthase-like glycosyltransferase
MEWTFWASVAAAGYAYAGYPLLLVLLARVVNRPNGPAAALVDEPPSVSVIVPVHNERGGIGDKLQNTRQLDYPRGGLQVIFVSDGSTDGTAEYLRAVPDAEIEVVELGERGGKAAALNAGLARARHEIVVFSDASIRLRPDALRQIVRPFALPEIGCVSGEDHIEQLGGEGLYGRYELAIRRLESRLHSIVGASGSFYAQRRALCEPFVPALAPDFLSVLRTVERGYRAVAAPSAVGTMRAVDSPQDEFERKVRTLLRGMTTLREHVHLLNPFAFGWFAFALASHKVMRWLVPFFLIAALMSSAALAPGSAAYLALFVGQAGFYALAAAGLAAVPVLSSSLPVRVSSYFTTVSLATMMAWIKYAAGVRQELWSPSRR